MPSNFGDTFVDSYKFGTKIAQDEEQHAQAVVLEERKLAATQAMEAVRSEQLNKQIELQQQKNASDANYQFNSLTREATKDLMDNFIRVTGNPLFAGSSKMTAKELKQLSPNANPPEGEYVSKLDYGLVKQREMYQWQLGLADAKEKIKQKEMMDLINRYTSVEQVPEKETVIPGTPPGAINKFYSDVTTGLEKNSWADPAITTALTVALGPGVMVKKVADRIPDFLRSFSSGTPEQKIATSDLSGAVNRLNKIAPMALEAMARRDQPGADLVLTGFAKSLQPLMNLDGTLDEKKYKLGPQAIAAAQLVLGTLGGQDLESEEKQVQLELSVAKTQAAKLSTVEEQEEMLKPLYIKLEDIRQRKLQNALIKSQRVGIAR